MNRRDFLKVLGGGMAALSLPQMVGGCRGGHFRPNIIFIMADDVGLGEIGCCGGAYKTPRIDELAKTGVRFEYCYAIPLCGPSRCEALTGRYPFRTGLNGNTIAEAIQPDREVMIQTALKKAGYVTAQVGKWGQMSFGPKEWGFDEHLAFSGNGKYWGKQDEFYTLNGKRQPLTESQYLPDIMHGYIADFLARSHEKPFFLYYAMSHIHSRLVRTPDSKAGADKVQIYADNVAYMDKLVGKLIDELDRQGLREKTIVVFTGDNGSNHSTVNDRLLVGGKRTLLEGGSRVPLIVNWPGKTPAGQVRQDLIDFSDFFPTFIELGRASLPEKVVIDGVSFAAQVRGQPGKQREWVYVELEGESYVRDVRWKLTHDGLLFDMKDAPFNEILVPLNVTDKTVLDARKRLQEVLRTHPAIPATGDMSTPKWQRKRKAIK
jgi:arylsulfatase A